MDKGEREQEQVEWAYRLRHKPGRKERKEDDIEKASDCHAICENRSHTKEAPRLKNVHQRSPRPSGTGPALHSHSAGSWYSLKGDQVPYFCWLLQVPVAEVIFSKLKNDYQPSSLYLQCLMSYFLQIGKNYDSPVICSTTNNKQTVKVLQPAVLFTWPMWLQSFARLCYFHQQGTKHFCIHNSRNCCQALVYKHAEDILQF